MRRRNSRKWYCFSLLLLLAASSLFGECSEHPGSESENEHKQNYINKTNVLCDAFGCAEFLLLKIRSAVVRTPVLFCVSFGSFWWIICRDRKMGICWVASGSGNEIFNQECWIQCELPDELIGFITPAMCNVYPLTSTPVKCNYHISVALQFIWQSIPHPIPISIRVNINAFLCVHFVLQHDNKSSSRQIFKSCTETAILFVSSVPLSL